MTELPSHWSCLPVGELCDSVEKVDPRSLGRDVFMYVDIGALEPSSSSLENVIQIPTTNAPGRARQLIRHGDSIFATVRPYMKKVAFIPKEFDGEIASTGFCVLRPIQEKLHSKFLFYFLQSGQLLDQVLPLQRGVSYPAVRDNDLKNAVIPIPPIDEQHKIVELLEDHLSRLDAALADVKQAKLRAAQFRRSLLKSTFEEFIDNSVRIGDVVTFNRKKPVEFKNSELEVSFVPMPKVSEVSGQILLDESISHLEGQRRSLTYFENGDVIFAKITPCMENGKIALAKNLLNGAAYGSTEFHVLTPMESILPDFLRYFIGSDDFRADAERAMTGAVGQRRVPKTYLEGHAIPLPSINIQAEIVANLDEKLSRTDEAVKVAEKIERESARLRHSLLQAAFTGQLTKEEVSV